MKLKDDSDQLPNENDNLFEDDDFLREDNNLDQITPTELQRNTDIQDTNRHLCEGEEVIIQTKIDSIVSPHGSDELYGHIREVGSKVRFSGEKSHLTSKIRGKKTMT